MHRIAICTFSRAEYGLLKRVISHAALAFDTLLIAGGWHHGALLGNTISEVHHDALLDPGRILEVPFADAGAGSPSMAAVVSRGVLMMDRLFTEHPVDVLVVMGDRHELFAATLAALHHRIPVAHISGGEVSAGAIDDSVRHATTKLSHLHLVAGQQCAENVSRMGEEDWRIVITGEPGIDNIHSGDYATAEELHNLYGIENTTPLILVTLHPSTLETHIALRDQYTPLAEALASLEGYQVLITAPGAEAGVEEMVIAWQRLADKYPHIRYIPHLGSRNYLGVMRYAAVVAGNSSSGLTEAPSLGIPVVNIGGRQKGRMAATSILHCGYQTREILDAIQQATTPGHRERCAKQSNPYDPYCDGQNSRRVTEAILRLLEQEHHQILQKRFITETDPAQWNTLLP